MCGWWFRFRGAATTRCGPRRVRRWRSRLGRQGPDRRGPRDRSGRYGPEPEPESPLEDLKSAAVEYADSEAEAEQPEAEPEAEAGVESQDTAGPPKPAATKQEWINWAVSQGAEWIAATNSTKQQLMEQYGQRA